MNWVYPTNHKQWKAAYDGHTINEYHRKRAFQSIDVNIARITDITIYRGFTRLHFAKHQKNIRWDSFLKNAGFKYFDSYRAFNPANLFQCTGHDHFV